MSKKAATGRRAAKKENTKARIVAAALALFRSKGFDATTTKAIALYFLEQEVELAMAAVRGNARLRKASLDEKLFALVQTQLEYLAPHERFIGAAFVHALTPGSKLGPFSPSAQALQFRYLAFVQELVDDAVRRGELSAASWWTPHAFWVYYLGILLYWLHDPSPGKQQTLAFLDRSLKIGVAV